MAILNFFGGLASVFLMLAKIILCLLLAVLDRVTSAGGNRSGERLAVGEPPSIALKA